MDRLDKVRNLSVVKEPRFRRLQLVRGHVDDPDTIVSVKHGDDVVRSLTQPVIERFCVTCEDGVQDQGRQRKVVNEVCVLRALDLLRHVPVHLEQRARPSVVAVLPETPYKPERL